MQIGTKIDAYRIDALNGQGGWDGFIKPGTAGCIVIMRLKCCRPSGGKQRRRTTAKTAGTPQALTFNEEELL